jgi:hypothetical protein
VQLVDLLAPPPHHQSVATSELRHHRDPLSVSSYIGIPLALILCCGFFLTGISPCRTSQSRSSPSPATVVAALRHQRQ